MVSTLPLRCFKALGFWHVKREVFMLYHVFGVICAS